MSLYPCASKPAGRIARRLCAVQEPAPAQPVQGLGPVDPLDVFPYRPAPPVGRHRDADFLHLSYTRAPLLRYPPAMRPRAAVAGR